MSAAYSARAADQVLLALTSQRQPEPELAEWQGAGLVKPTWLKPVVVTITEGLLIRQLGTLQAEDYPGAIYALSLAIDSAVFLRARQLENGDE